MTSVRIRARSIIRPGNLLVEEPSGNCYIFFADLGVLSAAPIDPSLARAMIQCYEWMEYAGEEWIPMEQLANEAGTHERPAGQRDQEQTGHIK